MLSTRHFWELGTLDQWTCLSTLRIFEHFEHFWVLWALKIIVFLNTFSYKKFYRKKSPALFFSTFGHCNFTCSRLQKHAEHFLASTVVLLTGSQQLKKTFLKYLKCSKVLKVFKSAQSINPTNSQLGLSNIHCCYSINQSVIKIWSSNFILFSFHTWAVIANHYERVHYMV